MPDGFYKDVCAILKLLGFQRIGAAKGSHEKWQSTRSGRMLIVPHNLKSRHTANAILRDAGYDKKL